MSTLSTINKNIDLSATQKAHQRQEYVAKELDLVSAGNLATVFTVPEGADDISVKNCENLIGSIQIPVGVAGPVALRAQLVGEQLASDSAVGNKGADVETKKCFLPLATTEGALVASVNRGCRALREAGGARVMVRQNGITRAPVFMCKSGEQALALVEWFTTHVPEVTTWAESTSSYLKLNTVTGWVRGRYAFVRFQCDTGEAMGMNMISIAVQSVWMNLQAEVEQGKYPELQGIKMISLSSNACSDKKAGTLNGVLGRGFWVQAEVVVPAAVVQDVLKTTQQQLLLTQHAKNYVGSALAGSTAQNMQVANVIAALFAALGQDLAHVVDASQATTIIESYDDKSGDVFISVTLPSLPLGVVGGGTWLPAQAQARKLLGLPEPVQAWQVAAAVGAAVLAGELSGMAALSSNQLVCAHQALARGRK